MYSSPLSHRFSVGKRMTEFWSKCAATHSATGKILTVFVVETFEVGGELGRLFFQ